MQLEQVSKDGDERAVLDDVSLTVYEGEVFVVVGPPGAGKSSLLGIAAGLRVASGGKALVLGEEARAGRRDGARAPALVMPDGELALESTARENVELHLRATDDADGPGLVDAALEAAGLHAQAGTVAGELDRGQRRRLAIACALVADPSVLLLDEPTATLSAVERDEVWRVVDRRRDLGATTIIATTSIAGGAVHAATARGSCSAARCARSATRRGWRATSSRALGALPRHREARPRAARRSCPRSRGLEIDERVDHWAIEITTRQPRELLALLEADPEFPELLNVDEQGTRRPVRGPSGGMMASEEQARWEAQTLLDAARKEATAIRAQATEDAERQLEQAQLAVKGLLERVAGLERSACRRPSAPSSSPPPSSRVASRRAPSRSSARCASAPRRCSGGRPDGHRPRRRRPRGRGGGAGRASRAAEPEARARRTRPSQPRTEPGTGLASSDLEDAAGQLDDDAGAEDAQERARGGCAGRRRARMRTAGARMSRSSTTATLPRASSARGCWR